MPSIHIHGNVWFKLFHMKKQGFYRYAPLATILFVAFAIRLYKIGSPLWLDEIYGYRLAKLGFQAIIQNSWTDPHPPLYYLLQWVVSCFGSIKSEIGWRSIPFLSGVLTIAVIGVTVKDINDTFTSILVCLIAATMPSLVYYSQEARSFAFLILLASLSMWITVTILRNGSKGRWLWIGWLITSLLGLFSGYAYLMVAGLQLVFLGFYNHRRVAWWVVSIVVVGCFLSLIPFMLSSLVNVASKHVNSEPLTFWRTLQTLFAGEPLRYSFSISHTLFPLTVIGFFVVASIKTIRHYNIIIAYFLVQVALPLSAFFVLSPFLHIRLPLPEAKQFIILIPAFLVIMASGLVGLRQKLGHRKGAGVAIVVCGAMVFLNAVGLQSYWTHPKSPEGLAVLALRDKLQPGENVVSLHYSLNYALGFYTSGIPIYLNPKQEGDRYNYQATTSEHIFDSPSLPASWKETEDIRAGGMFWVLAHSTAYRGPMPSLISGCQKVEQETFSALNSSFEIMKVDCSKKP